MLNEWEEFSAYTRFPEYKADYKDDTGYMGRFTFPMLLEFEGFGRVLTILARGYLFREGSDGYDRIDFARRALLAWCSLSGEKTKKAPDQEADPRLRVNYGEYAEEFPELVNEDGAGWYYRHVHAVADFISANRTKVNKHIHCLAERTKQWEDSWSDKVKQYQVPIFTGTTRAEWALSFDAAIADALELGALRRDAVKLTYEQMAYIESIQPLGVPLNVLTTIAEYYIANKPYDSDWCVLPVTNIEAYLGSSALNKQYMNKIPTEFMQKKETSYGISVCKITI